MLITSSLINLHLREGIKQLSPWSRVLPEKLTGHQLVKKFPAFHGTQWFFTDSQQPATCLYPEPDQFSPYPPTPHSEGPF